MAPLDTSQPLTQFTLFPTLPVELRLAIYNTHNTPRIIFIDHQPHYKSKAVLFRNRSVPSTLLQVCRESRLFTLQTHTLAFLHHCKGADFYFDFKHDALCFQSVYIMKQFFNLPTRTGDGSPRVPFSVERRLRTIICGEGMGQMMDQLDFYALGRPELVISVRQEEAGNVYQASPEVSWDYQHPEPEDMEDLSSCGLGGLQVVRKVLQFPGFEVKFMEMTMDTAKVYLGVSPPPKYRAALGFISEDMEKS